MSEPRVTRKRDLEEVARRYLDGELSFTRFRDEALGVWGDLSRMALEREEREAWVGVLKPLRASLYARSVRGEWGPWLYDEAFVRECVSAALGDRSGEGVSQHARRVREVEAEIANVLLYKWDPIGIQDYPDASDEYDLYVAGVYRRIASGASVEDLASHLAGLQADMGVGQSRDVLLEVAGLLLDLDVSL